MGLVLKLPALLIIAGIWFLSSQRGLPRLKGVFGIDKVQHAVAYAVLTFSSGLWFSLDRWRRRRGFCFLVILVLASLYGVIDEVHQYFVPGRDCNVWDWAADTLGGALGAALVMTAALFMGRRNRGSTE